MARWYFLRHGPGELVPLEPASMDAFLRGETPLPADASGRLQYVGVEIDQKRGTVLGLERVWFGRCRVRDDGTLDQAHMLQVANAKSHVARRLEEAQQDLPPGLAALDASDRFQARWTHLQSRWEPERADLEALRALLNTRAGWSML